MARSRTSLPRPTPPAGEESKSTKSEAAATQAWGSERTPSNPPSGPAKRAEQIRGMAYRETVESIAVAIILALLFRAFVAEAFVIPTGSMAPALMGAHKDIFCPQCGEQYQVSSSIEDRADKTVVGTICSNCRYRHGLDLVTNKADATFSGDRILVSKFGYALADPKRWDVAVFKFPGNPKQNYIKRIVGLPDEKLMIHHGDIYTRPNDDASSKASPNSDGSASITDRTFTIQRKPPYKLLAMSHLVHDTAHQPKSLNAAGYPSSWQPWEPDAQRPPVDSWLLSTSDDGLRCEVKTSGTEYKWLRYFHRPPTADQWDKAIAGSSLSDVDPYSSRAIADFYAYNTFINVPRSEVYDIAPEDAKSRATGIRKALGFIVPPAGRFNSSYRSGDLTQFGGEMSIGTYNTASEGMHWVGDLIVEADLETSPEADSLLLEIVESGVCYRCTINLTDGQATLSIVDDQPRMFSDGKIQTASVSAKTSVRAGTRHAIRYSNADDQLVLWVDGKEIEFTGPTTFDHRDFRTAADDHPQYTKRHPLDAAPVGIAVRGGSATAYRMKIDRDKYYIATKHSNEGLYDYDLGTFLKLAGGVGSMATLQNQMGKRDRWDSFGGWQARRTVSFELGEDQFFPMGDNSPESKDARCWVDARDRYPAPDPYAYHWADKNYVPRDLLVGKAIMVFWPHPWNEPVMFTPNFRRISLIK